MLRGSTRGFPLRSGHGRGLGWELITPEKGRTRQRPRAVTPVARPRPSNEGAGQLANTRRHESTTATAQRAGKSGVGGDPISDSRWHAKQLGVGRACHTRAETRTAAPQATPGEEREEVGESSPRRPTGTRRGAAARAGCADRGLRRTAQQGGARSRRRIGEAKQRWVRKLGVGCLGKTYSSCGRKIGVLAREKCAASGSGKKNSGLLDPGAWVPLGGGDSAPRAVVRAINSVTVASASAIR